MPIYVYKGFEASSGKVVRGKIESENVRVARQKLRKEKVIVSEIKEEVTLSKGKGSTSGKVSIKDLTIMTRQFATLQMAHVPLDECLKALTEQVEHVVLRNTLAAVKDLVSEGKSLADAMAQYPGVFNRLYINMVRAGESSGSLGLVLERLADFQEYQVAIQGKIFSALAYPVLMIMASMGIIAYLFISVVPKLQKVFDSLNVTLPWYTKSLISVSEFLQARWMFLIVAGVAIYFLFKMWYNTPSGKLTVDRFSLKAPIIGAVVLRVNVSKFTKTLATLLSSGVPIIASLEITKNIISNQILAEVLIDAKKAVQEGETLNMAIEKSKQFPALVTHMIRTGEKTGELEQMLQHVSTAYDSEVEQKIGAMISIIEPLMILLMGAIVAVVVVAMMVPMLSVMSQMR